MATATSSRRRRRDKQPKPKASRGERPSAGAPTTTTVRDVPDHLLELVFLRLGSSVDLVRAASACKRWRRVVADPGFLARFRSLRAPLVAGHYHTVDTYYDSSASAKLSGGRRPVFLPSPALTVDRRRFSLDFLPKSKDWKWRLADSRGSLLLLVAEESSRRCWEWEPPPRFYPDLVVCEPLKRCHQLILIPECLKTRYLGFFLLDGAGDDRPPGGGGSIGMSSFRVVAALHKYSDQPRAAVFASGPDGGWRLPGDDRASRRRGSGIGLPMGTDDISFLGRANGSLSWGAGNGTLLALDEATVEFSLLELPDNVVGSSDDRRGIRVVGGGGGEDDGALRVVVVEEDNVLKLFRRVHDESDEWLAEKTVRLPEATGRLRGRKARYFKREAMIVAADPTHVLVTPEETWLFSVELETMQAERWKARNRFAGPAYPCEFPWPPTLEACPARGRRRRSCR